jgi:peptidoglycan/xylan/chitin deacetylase (PgdA/CDA1 family)
MGKTIKFFLHNLRKAVSSLYYGILVGLNPLEKRLTKIAGHAQLGSRAKISGFICLPTPVYLEISDDVALKNIVLFPRRYGYFARGVKEKNVLCGRHTILTPTKRYTGQGIPERVLTLSVDVEGGVALSHVSREKWDFYRPYWDSRPAVEKLARLFRKYEMPVTWGVCGHLFLEKCDGRHGFSETDWFGSWFKHDPGSGSKSQGSWYMPDTVQMLSEEPLFDVGYHSFGHFQYDQCSEETVKRDMRLANELRKKWGLKMDSFVFPYNRCGHFESVVEKGGFRRLRGNMGRVHPNFGIIDFEDFLFFNTTEMFSPERMGRLRAFMPLVRKKAANFFTHGYQWLIADAWKELEAWLKELARLRDSGSINIKRMNQVK